MYIIYTHIYIHTYTNVYIYTCITHVRTCLQKDNGDRRLSHTCHNRDNDTSCCFVVCHNAYNETVAKFTHTVIQHKHTNTCAFISFSNPIQMHTYVYIYIYTYICRQNVRTCTHTHTSHCHIPSCAATVHHPAIHRHSSCARHALQLVFLCLLASTRMQDPDASSSHTCNCTRQRCTTMSPKQHATHPYLQTCCKYTDSAVIRAPIHTHTCTHSHTQPRTYTHVHEFNLVCTHSNPLTRTFKHIRTHTIKYMRTYSYIRHTRCLTRLRAWV